MKSIFETTLKCQGCVDKITTYLDNEPSITHWEVDLLAPKKNLTVEFEAPMTDAVIVQEIGQLGFKLTKVGNN